jgi:pimeloyl-ACP methyl ester carboxylesterase
MSKLNQLYQLPDGRQLGYNEYGPSSGKPLFYFHGSPTARIEFELYGNESILHTLNVRVIAADRPGMGLSDFQPDRRLLDWPKDVLAIADHLNIEHFAVLAYSLGAPSAAACAFSIPQRLTKLGIVSGYMPLNNPAISDSINAETQRFLHMHEKPRLWGLFLWSGVPMARFAPNKLIATAASVLPESDQELMADPEFQKGFLAMVQEALRQGPRGALHESRLASADWGFDPQDIQIPVFLWHGETDRNAPISMGRYLANAFPDCKATFYPGEGHLSLFKKKVQEIIQSLID